MSTIQSSLSLSALDPEMLILNSYEEAAPFWMELNRTYKSDELALDWKTHKLIWDHFYAPRESDLQIVIGLEKGKCTAIFPLIKNYKDPTDPPWWSFSDDFIVAREYFCSPAEIGKAGRLLPPHYSDDLSCFYIPHQEQGFATASGGLVDLKENEEEYLSSLTKKHRNLIKKTSRINMDLNIRMEKEIRWDHIQSVLRKQMEYWEKRSRSTGDLSSDYSRDKILTDLKIMERAQEMGKLLALYVYKGNELVMVNFSVRREDNRVDDYLCLRDCSEESAWRGLGIYAIIRNMEYCRRCGIRYYDLSSCIQPYKRKFINMESRYYHFHYEEIENERGRVSPDIHSKEWEAEGESFSENRCILEAS